MILINIIFKYVSQEMYDGVWLDFQNRIALKNKGSGVIGKQSLCMANSVHTHFVTFHQVRIIFHLSTEFLTCLFVPAVTLLILSTLMV